MLVTNLVPSEVGWLPQVLKDLYLLLSTLWVVQVSNSRKFTASPHLQYDSWTSRRRVEFCLIFMPVCDSFYKTASFVEALLVIYRIRSNRQGAGGTMATPVILTLLLWTPFRFWTMQYFCISFMHTLKFLLLVAIA